MLKKYFEEIHKKLKPTPNPPKSRSKLSEEGKTKTKEAPNFGASLVV